MGARQSTNPGWLTFKGYLKTPLDKFGANGVLLIPFVLSLSNHEWNQFMLTFPKL